MFTIICKVFTFSNLNFRANKFKIEVKRLYPTYVCNDIIWNVLYKQITCIQEQTTNDI